MQIKIIRLARTIADLRGEDSISDEALKEAMALRKMNISSNKLVNPKFLTGEKDDISYR